MSIVESGQDIQLYGKSGEEYQGRIYADKNATSNLSGKAIVCLTNSRRSENSWHHDMNSVYHTEDIGQALDHFKIRDDISHLILIPQNTNTFNGRDQIDDLIRRYLHG